MLVLLSFVICHLLAHSLLIVSLDTANVAFDVTMYVWQTRIGTGLLLAAFFVHYGNALWSIYVRRPDDGGALSATTRILVQSGMSSNHHPAPAYCLSVIPRLEPEGMLFGRPGPTFRVMLQ